MTFSKPGYYDYAPVVAVDKHVSLISFLTNETRAIGFRVAALSGLRFVDLDRLIEHRSGVAVAKLVRTEGEVGYRTWEREVLRTALADSPPAVISLGDGCLMDPASRELVTQRTLLFGFDLDLANCLWRVRDYEHRLRMASSLESAARQGPVEVRERPWHPVYGEVQGLDDFRPYYQERRVGLDAAHRLLPARGQSVERLAEKVLEILETRGPEPMRGAAGS